MEEVMLEAVVEMMFWGFMVVVVISIILYLLPVDDNRWRMPRDVELSYMTTRDLCKVPYWSKGNGQTIILVHSVGCSSVIFFFLFRTLTAKGYRVITYDLRGHGMCSHSSLFTASILAMDLVVISSKRSASAMPNKFQREGIVLVSSFPVSPARVESFPWLYKIFSSWGFLHVFFRFRTLARVIARPFFGDVDLTPDLKKIEAPCLVVCGSDDKFAFGLQCRYENSNTGKVIRLERMGHMLPWEAPDSLTQLVKEFITTNMNV
ncbi:hypothetical protein GUITHDRAFT_110627 [Guillardia theta CCMP2712]|uniref:AB hydrolase-1 domain-containing protein n=1 Tax=Guillardia theta (strain CCMP2712) TaxID=905079 RepID=L1J4P1_GUITC|nr:hypothetical protein GUITHDRAFT_110627 [Guillardia theta CCMP2712]EKX43503.1 hypothetical protein GUITHDRAFT_110627 [Guillardia theta CCMP2712]|eukprot:XP_005830483.1 hypothetical protein GUITHDRAFT_110627 [Guillardia theta CCMP2712]